MNRWRSVMRRPVRFVLNLEWFRAGELVLLHDFALASSRACRARLLIEERYAWPVRAVP